MSVSSINYWEILPFSIMTADLFISLSNSIKYIHIHTQTYIYRERVHVIKSRQIENTDKAKNSENGDWKSNNRFGKKKKLEILEVNIRAVTKTVIQ